MGGNTTRRLLIAQDAKACGFTGDMVSISFTVGVVESVIPVSSVRSGLRGCTGPHRMPRIGRLRRTRIVFVVATFNQ